jgi:hypothetical protein
VQLSDGSRGEVSGVKLGSVKVSFGDGRSGGGRKTLRHRYSRGSTYTIVISAADNAGNKMTAHKVVRVS